MSLNFQCNDILLSGDVRHISPSFSLFKLHSLQFKITVVKKNKKLKFIDSQELQSLLPHSDSVAICKSNYLNKLIVYVVMVYFDIVE